MTLKANLINLVETIHTQICEIPEADTSELECWADSFDGMLDDLLSNDFFGSEGQADPRGDHRDYEEWSVYNMRS